MLIEWCLTVPNPEQLKTDTEELNLLAAQPTRADAAENDLSLSRSLSDACMNVESTFIALQVLGNTKSALNGRLGVAGFPEPARIVAGWVLTLRPAPPPFRCSVVEVLNHDLELRAKVDENITYLQKVDRIRLDTALGIQITSSKSAIIFCKMHGKQTSLSSCSKLSRQRSARSSSSPKVGAQGQVHEANSICSPGPFQHSIIAPIPSLPRTYYVCRRSIVPVPQMLNQISSGTCHQSASCCAISMCEMPDTGPPCLFSTRWHHVHLQGQFRLLDYCWQLHDNKRNDFLCTQSSNQCC